MKPVKKRTGLRISAAALCVAALLLGAAAVKLFLIGEPASADSILTAVTETDGALEVTLMSAGSAEALRGWRVSVKDGAAYVEGRKVLVSALCRSGIAKVSVPLEGVSRVYVCGKPVWEAEAHQP